ncbi:MAG: hypothetical protein IJG33_02630 [Selenomonadaceae bacterium]|nr:hypothetical protein [Selenomonadaceae bacterium]
MTFSAVTVSIARGKTKFIGLCGFSIVPTSTPQGSIAAIKELAPKAYRSNKKKNRVFKSICDALGVTDETRGSSFQHIFVQFADELNGKKIDFKLYLSINLGTLYGLKAVFADKDKTPKQVLNFLSLILRVAVL